MARRHHKKLLRRRQFGGPGFAENTPPSDSSSADSTSSNPPSPDEPVVPPSGNPGAGNTNSGNLNGNSGNNPNNPNNPNGSPIGRPNNPNPVSSPAPTSNPPSQASPSIPAVDPFPPKGANQPPVISSSPSSNVPTSTSAPPSSSTTSATSSSLSSTSVTSPSSLVSSPTSPPTQVAAQVPPTLPTSSSLVFNSLNTPSSSAGPHTTLSGFVAAQTGNSTSTTPSSSSISTPAIVGIAVGGLCGLAILGAVVLWLGKRVSRYMETKELEPPPMHELVADEDPALISRRPSGPSSTPRPPTMIERRQANLAGRGNGFYNNGFGSQNPTFPPYGAPDPRFGNASPFAHGQFYPAAPVNQPPAVQPYFSPIAAQTSPFDDSAAAIPSAPGTPVYFSRQNSMQSGFASVPSSGDPEPQLPNPYDNSVARPNDGYATLNRGPDPATPRRQYTDLVHQLDFSPTTRERTISPVLSTGSYATAAPMAPQNTGASSPKSPSFKAVPMSPSVINVPTALHEGRATPVQFGFAGPASAPPVAQPGIQASTSQSSRPETIYDEEDAYAAI